MLEKEIEQYFCKPSECHIASTKNYFYFFTH